MTVAEVSPGISMRLVASLAQVPLFRDLPVTTLRDFSLSTRELRVEKGQFLFQDGRRPHALFHLLTGQVKLGISSDEGDEKIIEIYSPGESFGLAEIFSTQVHRSFAQATSRSLLLQIGKDVLLAAMEREPLIFRKMVTWLADRSATLEQDIASYCIHSARRRVLDFFLSQVASSAASGGKTIVTLSMHKRLIAARLSLTPEAFSRALRDLSAAGLISVRGRHITLEETLMARHAAAVGEAPRSVPPGARNRRRSDTTVEPNVGPNPSARPIGTRSWI